MVILLNKIYCPEEQQERAAKALRLNGGPDYIPATEKLLSASSTKKKPTVRIKRLGLGRLKSASSIQNQLQKEKDDPRLLAASSTKKKPTVRIKLSTFRDNC